MRRNFLYFVLLTMLFGCSVQERQIDDTDTIQREFHSVISPSVKTSLNEDGKVDWTKGDAVSYYSANAGSVKTFTISDSGHSALIKTTVGATDKYLVAVFGASGISENTQDGCMLAGAISSVQSGLFADAHIAVAKTSDLTSGTLSFHNVSSLIEFSLSRKDVEYVGFSTLDGTAIQADGRLKITFAGDKASASFPEDAKGNCIRVNTDGSGHFYLATLPCTINGFQLDFYDNKDEQLGYIEVNKTLSISENRVISLGELDARIIPGKPVAKVGNKKFSSIADAVSSLNSSEETSTLQLLENVETTGSLSFTNKIATITLDLNGKTLSLSQISSSADSLVITDNSSSQNGKVSASGTRAISLSAGSTTLAGGNVIASSGGVIITRLPSKFYMRGGRLHCKDTAFYFTAKGPVTMSGGRVEIEGEVLYFDNTSSRNASMVITGGCFNKRPENFPIPYIPKFINDTTVETVAADIIVGVSRWNGTWVIFRNSIEAAGAYAKRFMNYATSETVANSLISQVDALVIPGKATGDTSDRAACEKRLIKSCIDKGKPVLGICYGVQQINKYKGGNVPSVESLAPTSTIPHKLTSGGVNIGVRQETHSITIDKNSILSEIYGGVTTLMVNTSHNYACGTIGKGMKVVATAPDGIVEAIEPTDGSLLYGLQFHPEALYYYTGNSLHLAPFKFLIKKAKEVKK